MTNTVWIILSADQVSDQLREYIDDGFLSDANKLSYELQSYQEKLKSFCQQCGGHMAVNLYDRSVMQIPLTAAEEVPNFISDYQEKFGNKLSVGIGLTFSEAAIALDESRKSGEIELYDREEALERAEQSFELPPNMFDPKYRKDQDSDIVPKANKVGKPKPIMRPPHEQESQMEQQYLAGVAQTMGMAPPQQQQQQPQEEPRDLMEALHGQAIPGRDVTDPTQTGQQSAESGQSSPSGDKESDDSEAVSQEVDAAEKEAEKFNKRLAQTLATVKQNIPQIMGLSESNPDAFNRAMKVIEKLIGVAHSHKKVSKQEIFEEYEELEKAFRLRGHAHFLGRTHRIQPIGTVIGRRKKVLIDGKAVWRSIAAGQVKDSKGNSISVKSSNYLAEKSNDPSKK